MDADRRMKILQVIFSWQGGAIRVAFDVARALSYKGNNVTIFTTDIWKENKDITKEAVGNVRSLHTFCPTLAKKIKFYFTPEVISLAKNVKFFDILHLHEYRTFQNIVIHHYAKKYRIPYILQAHGSLPRKRTKKRLKWIYDFFFGYRLLRDASMVIALNHMEVEQYRSMGVSQEKIVIIPNGINLSEYNDLPSKGEFKKKFNIPEDKNIILYLGRIHKTKGIDLLVKSFSILVNSLKPREIILVIVGPDDGYLDELRSLASSLGILDSILFTGFVSAEDKRKALVDADIFVTPSFSGCPLTFLEACATGTPIITTILGDNLEWIDGKAGYATIPTPSNLSDAMYKLLLDDDLYEKFSENCKSISKSEFSLDVVIDKLEQLYARAQEMSDFAGMN